MYNASVPGALNRPPCSAAPAPLKGRYAHLGACIRQQRRLILIVGILKLKHTLHHSTSPNAQVRHRYVLPLLAPPQSYCQTRLKADGETK